MACTITISSPVGQETSAGQGLTTLTVSGTATGCDLVRVQVHQTQPVNVFTPQKTATVTNSQWSVNFTVAANDFRLGDFICGRGNKYEISVECIDGVNNCSQKFSADVINCGNCPDVNITITPGDCVNGRRTVHIRADVISANDATYTWFFGTDEDNQLGEDSQSGDGSGIPWLPAPDSNGVRVVEVDHIYEATGNQPQMIGVRLVTSSGPTSVCSTAEEFTLEPCKCDLVISLQVKAGLGEQPLPTNQCFPPGDYIVEVTSPTGANIDYSWSVNGIANSSQNNSTFGFSINSGEEKTISVFVEQGSCDGSNAVTVKGCEDCSNFDAQLRILDDNRREVSNEDCLPPGNYTVQATSPTGTGNTFRWQVDNVVDTTATSNTLQVNLGDADEKIVTLETSRGECRDIATVVLEACPDDIIPPDDDVISDRNDGFIPCLLFKLLALMGLGLVFMGAILLLCPAVALPFPPQVASAIGIGLVVGGAALLVLGLLLWFLICQPDSCNWLAFLWQALVLLGLLMIYAGFCPACSWMLLGIVPLILGAGTSILWGRNCDVTRCGVLAEWISLFTFVVNVVAILEMILAACVITSRPIASFIWGVMIATIQAWLWYEANRGSCIRD